MEVFREMRERQQRCLNPSLLIIDLNYILHKAVYVNSNLYADSVFTGGLHGVLSQIKTVIIKYDISQIIICNDNPPYFRSSLFDNFKSGRKKRDSFTETKIHTSRQMCEDLLGKMFTLWKVKGMESDDLIMNVVNYFSSNKKANKIFILSEDSDLFQCLVNKNVLLIRKGVCYGKGSFKRKYKINPSQWAWVSALSGGHNGLPGFKGIGEKTALKIVQDEKLLLDFVQKNPIALTYFHLSKLPLFKIKSIPEIKILTEQSIDWATVKLKCFNFKVN